MNVTLGLLVPLAVVTVTGTVPVASAGVVATITLFEFTVKTAGIDPKCTLRALVKPFPMILTVVPPLAGPRLCERWATSGGAW